IVVADASEDEDSQGENGDGTATSAAQIRALHADLADKNRYISTLEKRLLQARRSSHSRVSRTFSSDAFKGGLAAGDVGMETQLKEKDAEIADLRARLDDKDRMVAALRSAARKRDMADLAIGTTPPEG
ncbi:Kinesin-like protein kip2, partial [Cryomyces antarcticus]